MTLPIRFLAPLILLPTLGFPRPYSPPSRLPTQPPIIHRSTVPSSPGLILSRNNYGIDVFSYDYQLAQPATVQTIQALGMGMQQFPNENQWSWVSNNYRTGGGPAPVSLAHWGRILHSTSNTGLFIFDYDESPSFTHGGTAHDATELTQYIVQHHLPITAIVIGSEEYGPWDFSTNLHHSKTAATYAAHAKNIAQAIHTVDPAMKVGVSISLGMGSYSRTWNQTVLRTDSPFIQFLSIHDYPLAQTLSNSALLTAIPTTIHTAMTYIHQEIAANVPPAQAQTLQTWVTEYNPYGEPGVQSTQTVYGAAMLESALLWRQAGAQKLFIWSFDGGAHIPNTTASAQWPVANQAGQAYGLFALVGDGFTPELPMNQFYPSGTALVQLMQAIGSHATLTTQTLGSVWAAQIQSAHTTSLFLVNRSASSQTVTLGNKTYTIAPATYQDISLPVPISLSAPTLSVPQFSRYHASLPQITGPLQFYPGERVTLTGGHWGSNNHTPAFLEINQNGIHYGGPGDDYHIKINSWTPSTISFTVPNGYSGPGLTPGHATLQLGTNAGIISNKLTVTVTDPPIIPATITNISPITPGTLMTITGENFGTHAGFLTLTQNHVNYGAPGDSYHLQITQWTPTRIVVRVPNGYSGPSLQSGAASVTITTAQGLTSHALPFTISSSQ